MLGVLPGMKDVSEIDKSLGAKEGKYDGKENGKVIHKVEYNILGLSYIKVLGYLELPQQWVTG